jgi:hypothetical protein
MLALAMLMPSASTWVVGITTAADSVRRGIE